MQPHDIREKLVQILDGLIEHGRWDSSLFLRNLLKRLQQVRATIAEKLPPPMLQDSSLEGVVSKEGYERVYIELYQSSCEDLTSWRRTIENLCEHFVSRPVYRLEEHVQELIRSKRSRTDAYVVVWVKRDDIMPSADGHPVVDRFGHEVVRLKEGSVKIENIIEFVHDKLVYIYKDEQLVVKKV